MSVKKIVVFNLLMMLVTMFHLTGVFATTADTLVIHYMRYDEQYSDKDVWLWPNGGDGQGNAYSFNGTDEFGVTLTVDLSATNLNEIDELGFIIRIGGDAWGKDVDMDRFIDMTRSVNGEVHVYVVTQTEWFSYVSADTANCDRSDLDPFECSHQKEEGILNAYFDINGTVVFTLTDSVVASDIEITADGVLTSFTGFSSGNMGSLQIGNFDINKTYVMFVNINNNSYHYTMRLSADYDSDIFNQLYNYEGSLGFEYSTTSTTFRIWAPISSEVKLNLYTKGHSTQDRSDGVNTPYEVHDLSYIDKGMWSVTVSGDLHNVYYTYSVKNEGSWVSNVMDPWAYAAGYNGYRSLVVDFSRVNPEDWNLDSGVDGYTSMNDAIIYELHVRDLTSSLTWGGPSEYSGKYMGFTVSGTTYTNPVSGVTVTTGLDHLVELGITHVHLLPVADQDWNDEANFSFNWGYNPANYNVVEGGYATDPFDGLVRINEFKQMVQALHTNDINVVLDVVYNHTGPGGYYSFNRIVPGYFYRMESDGSYSNGSGCGNETASERYMVNKFIRESVEFWAEEYHVDGFRFDLMSLHDYETMDDVARDLDAIDEDIIVYGEPWTAGSENISWSMQAGEHNLWQMYYVGAFNDQFRNTLKGSPDGTDAGYVTTGNNTYDIKKGIIGSYTWGYPDMVEQSINYVTAHDNLTLYDKLLKANGVSSYTTSVDYQARLANAIVLLSQGTPFLHGGVEFLRTKGGNHNSYNASDSVNQFNYLRKSMYVSSYEWYKGIIDIRQAYESFRMDSKTTIQSNLSFLSTTGTGLIGYKLTDNNEEILVYFNSDKTSNSITLPSGAWKLLANRDVASVDGYGTYKGTYPIAEAETLIFVRGNESDVIDTPLVKPNITTTLNVMYEGAVFNISSNMNIYSYTIDNVEYTVDTPKTTVSISGITAGVHKLKVINESGIESDEFTLTVIKNEVDPIILNTNSTLLEGSELILDINKEVVGYYINDVYTSISSSNQINLGVLDVDAYQIKVKDSDGEVSDIYSVEVIAKAVCTENQTYNETNNTCEQNVVVCADGEKLINNQCVEETSSLSENVIAILVLVVAGIGIIIMGVVKKFVIR